MHVNAESPDCCTDLFVPCFHGGPLYLLISWNSVKGLTGVTALPYLLITNHSGSGCSCCHRAQTKQILNRLGLKRCLIIQSLHSSFVHPTSVHLRTELTVRTSNSPLTSPAVYQTVQLDLRVSAHARNAPDSRLYPRWHSQMCYASVTLHLFCITSVTHLLLFTQLVAGLLILCFLELMEDSSHVWTYI